eukprot:TRINITY_DN4132_c0_g1_i1.p1 TRINITY_DN4132_c0_g1~~TRINITY_DN4132_c0_g1_i1.p1  ORF type:complete len:130 (+),score=43.50 TRINITY_DN4132_c0_g1_i1:25-390(+)
MSKSWKNCYDAIFNGNWSKYTTSIELAEVDFQDPADGNTLLHWGVAFKRANVVKDLLERHAKQVKNTSGKTPLDIAIDASKKDASFIEVKRLLEGKPAIGADEEEKKGKAGIIEAGEDLKL